jgi:WD40 repeat protein
VRPDPSSFFVTGGALSSEAPSYVPRQADRELIAALRAGEFCYVLTPRQMGKSSLMVRTVAQLRTEAVDAAVIDLTAIGLNVSADQWYRGQLTELGEQLDLEDEVRDVWQRHADLAPTQRWQRTLRELLRGGRPRSLVIFIDEIDAVRSLPFQTDGFFAAIREIYNRRAREPTLRLTFCLLGVASPTDLIAEPALTPFNVGRRIELADFTEAEASRLAWGLGRPPDVAAALLRRVLFWTGAHPYLTQRLCQAVALDGRVQRPRDVDRCCHELFLSAQARDRDDNLVFVREHLLTPGDERTALLDLYASILGGSAPPDDTRTSALVSALQLSGVISAHSGRLRVRNRIYARVFSREWVTRHLPDAEVRRQRAAFRRGLTRAGSIAVIVLAAVLAAAAMVRRERDLLRVEQAYSRRLLYAAEINLAAQAWEGASAERTEMLLDQQVPSSGQDDLRGFEWSHLWWLVRGEPRGVSGTAANPTVVTYAPDGGRVAVAGWNGVVEIWDATAMQVARRITSADPQNLNDLAFSPDGRWLAAAGGTSVLVWDASTGALLFRLEGHDERVWSVAFSPDGRLLATGSADRTIRLWTLAERRVRTILRGHASSVNAVRFSADGTRLVSAGADSTARVWKVDEGSAIGVLEHAAAVDDAIFTADGRRIVTAGWEAALSVWDASTRKRLRQMDGHTSLVLALAIARDGRTLASAGIDGTVRLWDLDTGRERSRIRAAGGKHVRSISFAPDGRRLATVSDNGALRFWEVAGGETSQEATTLHGHSQRVSCVSFSPDERRLITGSWDGSARIWRADTGQQTAVLPHAGIVNAARFSPDGATIVTADDTSGVMTIWDAATGQRLRTVRAAGAIVVPRFTPDGSRVVAIAGGSGLVRWNAATWSAEAATDTHLPLGRMTAVSPDGTTLVTANDSGQVRFWSIDSLRERAPMSNAHSGLVSSIEFSPGGEMMATGSFDGSVRLWDWRAGTVTAVLRGHQGWIGAVAFSPDGRRIVTGGQDGTVKFWSTVDWQELVSFQRHRDLVSGLAFTRDGHLLASAGGIVTRLWRGSDRGAADRREWVQQVPARARHSEARLP